MSRKIVLTLLFSSSLSLLALEYDPTPYESLSQGVSQLQSSSPEFPTSVAGHINRNNVIVGQSNVPIPYRNGTKGPINSSSPSNAVTAQPLAPVTPSQPADIPQGPTMPASPSSPPVPPQATPSSSSTSSKPSNVKPASVTSVPNTPIIVAPAIIPFLPVPKPVFDQPIITPTPVVPPTEERPTGTNSPSTNAPAPHSTSPVIPPYNIPSPTKNPATAAPILSPVVFTKQPIVTPSPIVPPVLQPHGTAPVVQPTNSIPSSPPVHSNIPVSKPSPTPVIPPATQPPTPSVPTIPTGPTPSGHPGSNNQRSPLWKAFTYLFLLSLLAYGCYLGYVNRGTIIFILGRMVIECAFRTRRSMNQIRNRLRQMTGGRRRDAEPTLNDLLFEDSTQAELSTRLISTTTESTE
jgi:hypothetical protein